MAYIKYKEVTKYFNFSKVIELDKLPKYTLDYIYNDEEKLVAYKTTRDYGIFTNKKMVLFDNTTLFNNYKQVFTIPYSSVSTCSIIYKSFGAEMSLFLDSGYPLRLKFINMKAIDKKRIRILYTCICRYINNQVVSKEDEKKLIEDDISFEN